MTRRAPAPRSPLHAPRSLTLRRPAFTHVCLTLVGCGGTGSHIASGLASLNQSLSEKSIGTDILFIDPDVVEARNVGRQLFSRADVGRSKSLVLAERVNAAFATTVGFADRKVDALDKFGSEDGPRDRLCVVIGAVDNSAARQVIERAVKSARGSLWWLDAGNENASGQVALGNSFDEIEHRLGIVSDLPAPSVVYPDLVRSSSRRGVRSGGRAPSCAELAAEGVQGLMVNRMAAAWALALLHDFLLGDLRYFAVAFDLAHGNASALPLDAETLRRFKEG